MITINTMVEIKVDEDKLKKNYPNFNINYPTIEDFIQTLQHDLEGGDIDLTGFSIKLVTREEWKALDELNQDVKDYGLSMEKRDVDKDCSGL